MAILKENEETGCCKRFDPTPWTDKEVNFENRLFIKDHVRSFFHIPINYGKVMKRNMEEIEKAGAKARDPLMLSDENSLWGSDIYIAVDKIIPGKKWSVYMENFFLKYSKVLIRKWANGPKKCKRSLKVKVRP